MYELLFCEIKPFIRYAHTFCVSSNTQFKNLKNCDYRCFYCYSGTGNLYVDNKIYNMSAGSFILWNPALTYSIEKTNNNFQLIGINFDFTMRNCHRDTAIPPMKKEKFSDSDIIENIIFSDIKALSTPIYIKNIESVENKLFEIVNEYKNKKILFINKISGIFIDVITEIIRIKISVINKDKNNIDLILNYIHKNFHKEISNKNIGDAFNYHPNYLNRLMVLHTGMSLHKYVLNYRLNKAINLIQTTNMQISEICTLVGFNDFTHFSKYFKKKIGKSPSDFK